MLCYISNNDNNSVNSNDNNNNSENNNNRSSKDIEMWQTGPAFPSPTDFQRCGFCNAEVHGDILPLTFWVRLQKNSPNNYRLSPL